MLLRCLLCPPHTSKQCSPDDASNAVVELLDAVEELEQSREYFHFLAPLLATHHSLGCPLPDQTGQAIQCIPQGTPTTHPAVAVVVLVTAVAAVPVELISEHVLLSCRDEAFQQEPLAGLERAQHPAARVLAEERRDARLCVERAELVAERARRAEPLAGGGEARDLRGDRRVPVRLSWGRRGRGSRWFPLDRRGGDALRARGRRGGRRRQRGEEAAPTAARAARGARVREWEARREEGRGVEAEVGRSRRGGRARGHGFWRCCSGDWGGSRGAERAGRRLEP